MAELARMTWPEAREALGRARVAILPVGSCEQHGPHMTLDTDLAVAEASPPTSVSSRRCVPPCRTGCPSTIYPSPGR
jgi:creatinine amidohydrolase/Fe(II)-dependent formamide hydrolase-like protein